MRPVERGSFAIEAALAVPLLLMAMMLFQLAWRVSTAQSDVQAAAARAARSASLTDRNPAGAARATATATIADRNVTCRALDVSTDVSSFRPGGTVTVRVRCTADLSDLTMLKLPGTHLAEASATEVIDRYRGAGR